MDSDGQINPLEQTTSSALNITNDFENELGESMFNEESILDETSRECK